MKNNLILEELYGPGPSSEVLVSEWKCTHYVHATADTFRKYVRDLRIPYYVLNNNDVRFRWSEVREALEAHGIRNLPTTADEAERNRETEARRAGRMERRLR